MGLEQTAAAGKRLGKHITTVVYKQARIEVLEAVISMRSVSVKYSRCSETLRDRVRTSVHSEIALIVRHLKPRKATGPDGIKDAILQHLEKVPRFIAKAFTRSLALYCFPVQLKRLTSLCFRN
jgi:hypothetical protein